MIHIIMGFVLFGLLFAIGFISVKREDRKERRIVQEALCFWLKSRKNNTLISLD